MVQEAASMLETDAMWQDPKRAAKRKSAEVDPAPVADENQNRFSPIAEDSMVTTRQRALAICDRLTPFRRGRSLGGSPPRSRDRKELVQELQQRVEQQKKATIG